MITSLPDLIIIGGVALLVFGPKRVPELAHALGKGIRDFKRAMDGQDEVKPTSFPPAAQQQPPVQVAPPTNAPQAPQQS